MCDVRRGLAAQAAADMCRACTRRTMIGSAQEVMPFVSHASQTASLTFAFAANRAASRVALAHIRRRLRRQSAAGLRKGFASAA
ncbi:MAG: hypothetical protein FWD90_01385 [Defluviitaleaceae bacterium]|nr:hypothetical protein [Defluviitaleaceae bacterium]